MTFLLLVFEARSVNGSSTAELESNRRLARESKARSTARVVRLGLTTKPTLMNSLGTCSFFVRKGLRCRKQVRVVFADEGLFFCREFGERDGFVLRAGAFLVDAVDEAPIAGVLAGFGVDGFLGREVVAGEVDDHFLAALLIIAQQGESEVLVHEPADLLVGFRGADAAAAVDELVVEFFVVRKLRAPQFSEFTLGDELGIGPAFAYAGEPEVKAFHAVAAAVAVDFAGFDQAHFPTISDPGETVALETVVEVRGGGGHHGFESAFGAHVQQRFDGAHALPAAPAFAVHRARAGNAGAEEIDRPAVEVDDVDEVIGASCWFTEVFARRIVGIADRTFAIAVVHGILAPDVALADVDVFLFREVAEVVGGEESGDDAFRPVAVADDFGNSLEAFVKVAVHLFAGVVHVGKVGAGDERDLVVEFLLIGNDEFAQFAVGIAFVVECEPTEGPGDARAGPCLVDGFAECAGFGGCVDGGFVRAVGGIARHFDLADADDGVEREEAVAEEGIGW